MGNKAITYSKRFERFRVNEDGVKTTSATVRTLIAERVGADDPNWRSKVARGSSATNYMFAKRTSMDFNPSSVTLMHNSKASPASIRGKTVVTQLHHPVPLAVIFNVPSSARTRSSNDAATCILKKVEQQVSTFSGLPLLGELRKSVAMIRHPAEALAGLLNKSIAKHTGKKGKGRGKRPPEVPGVVQTAGNTWLEGVFGWAPLVADINGMAEATLRRYNDAGIKRVVCAAEEGWSSSSIKTGGSNDYQTYYYDEEIIGSCLTKFEAGLRTNIQRSNNALERLVENGQTDWNDIIPAAYELMPWSFLLDYFGNIGDVLGAAAVSRANVAWSSRTVVISQETRCSGIYFKNGSSTRDQKAFTLGYSRSKNRTVEREAVEIPIPEFQFELPGHKGQLLNIAALLAARLRF